MKTVNIIIAALVFFLVSTSFQKGPIGNSAIDPGTGTGAEVFYQVNIHLAVSAPVCGPYLVEMVNANGILVAPPQTYIVNRSTYIFTEKTLLPDGIRLARMVPASKETTFYCVNQLYTPPQGGDILFEQGRTYSFDLYPQYNSQAIKH